MNKSKFLKKSLAALLAILMVAAMIPLSAAAAQVIGNGETIDVPGTTLAKGEDDYHWTATLPYNDTNGTATITLATDRQNVEFFTVGEDGTETTVATGRSAQVPVSGVTVSTPVTKTIVLRTIASDPAEVDALATYTVTVQKEATSTDATITGATVELNSITYTAVVEGDTITFNNIAWGRMPVEGTSSNAGKPMVSSTEVTLKVTMPNKPDATQSGFDVDAAHITDYKVENGVGTGKITAKAQNGNTKVYTVKFNEATSFTGITVAGVAAEQDTEDPTKWTVTIDEEDAGTSPNFAKIKASSPKTIKFIDVNTTKQTTAPASTQKDTFTMTATLSTAAPYYVAIVDNKGNFAINSLTVKFSQNNDTGIKAFKVSDGTYEEPGNVDTMTVTMPSTTTNDTLAAGTATQGVLAITFKGKMKGVTLNGTALNYFAADGTTVTAATTAGTFTSATNAPVSPDTAVVKALTVGNNTLVVTAEDGTQKTYNLVVKADPNKTTNPSIIGAKLNIPESSSNAGDEETVTASKIDQTDKTITFTVPASLAGRLNTTKIADLGEAIDWTVTPHTTINDSNGDSTFVRYDDGTGTARAKTYTDAAATAENDGHRTDITLYSAKDTAIAADDIYHSVTVTADSTNDENYKVYIEAANPNQVTRLTSIKFYDVENESEVTADNTYEARGNDANYTATLNKTLPYSVYNNTATAPDDNSKVLAVSYEIPARARIFWVGSDKKVHEFTKNGFDKKGRTQPGATITGAQLADVDKILVLSEAHNVTIPSSNATFDPTNASNAFYNKTGYQAYGFKKTKADASTLNQLVSLKSANGEVSAVIDGFNVNLIVPPTYVVKNNETEFDLVAEVSENATVTGADLEDPITFENAKVVENADGTYSLSHSGISDATIVVTAQDGSTIAKYALTVTVAELDGNADVSSITADGVAATEGEDDAWTVELPYGTDLEAVEVVATPASDKADAAVVKNDDGTYTITVTAERGNIKTYTLTVTVADKPAAPEFDDVPSWAQDAVNAVAAEGWMLGIGNNKFGPNGNIRRGDFALTIARILEEDWANVSADYAKDVFTDVKEGDWYYEAVAYIVDKGIMSGRGNGFDPRTGITREEAAKVMCLAMDLEPIEGETIFGDNASIAGWAKPYVNACQKAGVFNGTNGNFNPKDQLTRAQAAQIFKNGFIDYQPEDTTPDEPAE